MILAKLLNITTPRYDEYYRGFSVFPRYSSARQALPERANRKRGGTPRTTSLGCAEGQLALELAHRPGNADIDYLSKVPFRSIGR